MAYQRSRALAIRRARVEIVPLIDVMFLLLSFFIYVTIRMVPHGGIPVDLAPAKTAEVVTKDQRLVYLSIGTDGQLHLDQRPVTDAELAQALSQLKARKPPPTIVLNADQGVVHARVVQILDLTRQSGVPQVIFAVEPTTE